MVQFKDVFLGLDKRPYVRATTSQRCVRAGGKHNDLENVGYTARHHTFFEMLGNFSFGDYFKRDAIRFAWELLTKVYGCRREAVDDRLHRRRRGVRHLDEGHRRAAERVVRIGDNKGAQVRERQLLADGRHRPVRPCSEIFYDHGPKSQAARRGRPTRKATATSRSGTSCFMQFDRQKNAAGEFTMTPLPKPCVDTGMGLERLAAVMQHVHSNYEIDLFQALIKAAARETGTKDLDNPSLKVIADHIRACAFLVVDGVIPSSDGRGYVLRRIIRRAIRHGYQLGQKQPFFYKLVDDLDRQMGDAYPELTRDKVRVAQVLKAEEERFGETLENGMKILGGALDALAKAKALLDGETAFTLYDTFGFPLDLTADIARGKGVTSTRPASTQRWTRSATARAPRRSSRWARRVEYRAEDAFRGYETLSEEGRVVALYKDGAQVDSLRRASRASSCSTARRSTPSRAARSATAASSPRAARASRCSRRRHAEGPADVYGHVGEVTTGELRVGDTVAAQVDHDARGAHHAQPLGDAPHAQGAARSARLARAAEGLAGRSGQDALRLRAQRADDRRRDPPRRGDRQRRDPRQPSDQRARHADRRRAEARRDDAVRREVRRRGARARHRHVARAVRRHARRAHRRHRLFQDRGEGGVAAGIRRVEAVTGRGALAYVQAQEAKLNAAASAMKAPVAEIESRIAQLIESARTTEKELARLKTKAAASAGDDLASTAVDVKGTKVLAVSLDGADVKALRETMDKLKDKLKSAAIVLGSVSDGKVTLIAGVTNDLIAKVKAGELVNHVAQQVGGKGGGRPDMAQAGGTDPAGLPAALKSVQAFVEQRL
jgi:alanyl-tRNA synthetase